MAEVQRFAAGRILVGVDGSAASEDALAAAATLASRTGLALAGLFVEDEDVLRLAGLPFADIVRTPGGAVERLDRPAAEAKLRAVAAHLREALEREAASHRVACSFRVARGRVAAEVLAAAADADIVALGAAGHCRSARGAIGETARAAAARAPASVLLAARGSSAIGTVAALDDGTPAGSRARAAATRVAPHDRPAAVVEASGLPGSAMVARLARLRPSLVALPEASPGLIELLLGSGMAVLLVR